MKLIRLMPIAGMQDAVIRPHLALWLAQPHNPPAITYSESRNAWRGQMTRWIKLWIFASLFFGLAAGPARAGDAPEALTNSGQPQVVMRQRNLYQFEMQYEGVSRLKTLSAAWRVLPRRIPLYVPDSGNARVLGFKGIPKKNGASAKLVLGQANFSKIKFGATRKLFDYPSAVVTAGNQLLMTDFGNSRVLIWNKLPTKTNTPAAVVVGQPDLTSNDSATTQSGLDHPELGLFVAGGKLIVSDRNNNRVMIWNSVPSTNGANADVVIGQPNFTSKSAGTTETSLNEPEGIWSDGTRLVVADEANNRVLIRTPFRPRMARLQRVVGRQVSPRLTTRNRQPTKVLTNRRCRCGRLEFVCRGLAERPHPRIQPIPNLKQSRRQHRTGSSRFHAWR